MTTKHFLLILIAGMLLVSAVSADEMLQIYPTSDSSAIQTTANATWATLRAAAGSATSKSSNYNYGPSLVTSATTDTNKFNSMSRTIWSFNTSTLPDNAVISNVSFMVGRCGGKDTALGTPLFGITGGSVANNASVAAGDYDGFTANEYITRITTPASASITIVYLNENGRNYIDKTGYTIFFGRDSWDLDNSFGGSWGSNKMSRVILGSVTQPTVSYRPYINVTYTLPDTTPPGTIQGLTNDTTACEQITWDWQSPGDADFNGTMIYRDGTFLYNVSNTTYQDVWTGLTGGQTYEFASHTIDIAGNVDPDWVNQSATPTACTIAPVANFTADNTSICLGDPIQFTDTSTNSPTIWEWDFYDGNTSAEQNPIYTYVSVGVYGVSLNATNSAGSNQTIKKDYITVINCTEPGSDPGFSADHPCHIGVPMTVNFTGLCEEGPYKNYWEWNDGMGNHTEGVQNPQFTWEFYGTYTVEHTCEWGNASPTWDNKSNYITAGVEGTSCGRDTGDICVYQIATTPGIAWTAPFILVGASIGMIIMGRRKKKKNEEEF